MDYNNAQIIQSKSEFETHNLNGSTQTCWMSHSNRRLLGTKGTLCNFTLHIQYSDIYRQTMQNLNSLI
jgi:hypothetical protein